MAVTWCNSAAHSRPATPEERAADYAKREAAIQRAIASRSHTPAEISAARKMLETFRGYRRCTL